MRIVSVRVDQTDSSSDSKIKSSSLLFRDPRAGGGTRHTRSSIHAPIVPLDPCAHSALVIRLTLTHHGALPNTHTQVSRNRFKGRVQGTYSQTDRGESKPGSY